MTRQSVSENYPTVPDGFSLMREFDPETGLHHFRVKFTAGIEQTVTDELLATAGLSSNQLWGSAIRELENAIARRFPSDS